MEIIKTTKEVGDNEDGYYEVYWEIYAHGTQIISKNQASSMDEVYDIVDNMDTDELEEPTLSWDDFRIFTVEEKTRDGEIIDYESM